MSPDGSEGRFGAAPRTRWLGVNTIRPHSEARRRSLAWRAAALALALAAIAWGGVTPAASSAAVTARPADSFVNSIGVNVHLGYSNTVYNDFTAVRAALDKLGVRYIRDGVGLGRSTVYSRYRTLAEDGIGLDIIVGEPIERWGIGSLEEQLDMIESQFSSAVVSLEGPNEYDIQGDPNWIENLRDYQRRLWEDAHARPKLSKLPVLGPSFATGSGPREAGDLSSWADEGNLHPYPGGEQPDSDSHMNSELSLAAQSTGSEPVQATETGYQNAVNNTTSGNRPASEHAAGIYTPRQFLDDFRRGITRTFDYELIDVGDDPSLSNAGQHYGLLRNDFSEKPSYVALKNLIALLEDPGSAFTPGSLSYSVAGAPSSARQVLLQKRDGSFYLALWNQVSVWDTSKLADLEAADVPVTLKLGQAIERAEVFQPNASSSPTATYAGPSSLSLSLSPSVTVVKLVPAPGSEPQPEPEAEPEPQPEAEPEPEVATQPEAEPEVQPEAPQSEPESEPAPAPEAEESEVVSSEPSRKHTGRESGSHGKRQTRRALLRQVRTGCRHSSCPLRRVELHKARALLRLVPNRELARASASGNAASLAGWLRSRARQIRRAARRNGGWVAADRGVRYSTIRAVLGLYGAVSAPSHRSARAA